MPEQVKARTQSNVDSHARYHGGDWLTVEKEGSGKVPVLTCVCSCGNRVYIAADEVYRRRETPRG